MTNSKHTPGPWEWVKSKNDNWASYDLSPGILTKDTPDGSPWGDEIDRANAHLIAAAPELYEACREASIMLKHINVTGSLIDQIDSALAKARGEV